MTEKNQKFDSTFLVIIGIIVVFGLVMLTSASSPMGFERFGDSYYYLKHQIFQGLLPGLVAMAIFYFIPYRVFRTWALPMLLISVGLLILVFIPGVGQNYGTAAQSWLAIGPVSFQPAEIVKLTFLIYLSAWIEKRQADLRDIHASFIPFLLILGLISVLMYLQPDLGTLTVIVAMSLIVYFVAGGPIHYLLGLSAVGLGALAIAIKSSPYRAARLMTFLHPELDPQGIGYQINQALLAIGSGGLFGRGYGHSVQKFEYLPEVAGDSIFAVIGEELGLFMTVGFVLLFLVMILRGLKIASEASDRLGKYLVVGIISWFGVQGLINIGAMLGIMPITGVPLPFVSYGGTALTVSLAAVGIILNISKQNEED